MSPHRPRASAARRAADPRQRVGRPSRPCSRRDAYVLAHNLKEFLPRTLIQPFLLVFVFTYVLPKIGLGIGGSSGPPAAALKLMTPVAGGAGHQSGGGAGVGLLGLAHRRRDRLGDPVPGHPGRGPAAGAGVRLHPRDRGSGARAAAGRARRRREDRRRRAAVPHRRPAGLPDRRGRAGHAGPPAHHVVGPADDPAAGLPDGVDAWASRSGPSSIPARCRCCSA